MDQDTNLMPSSPSNSSLSSSDLDTESTGSFFPDRSTSLGTLMGVTFTPTSTPAANSRPQQATRSTPRRERGGDTSSRALAAASVAAQQQQQRRRRNGRGRSGWWRLCRDESLSRPKSLGEFLQVERRMGEASEVADGHFVCGGSRTAPAEHEAVGGGPLFADGRVLPPAPPSPPVVRRSRRSESVGRLPALLITGICSGGEG